MSIEQERPSLPSTTTATDLTRILDIAPPSAVDTTAAALEKALQREQDGRKEERFFWILACTGLLDAIIAPQMGLSFILVFLLQLAGLIYGAQRLGLDKVVVLLERLWHHIERRKPEEPRDDE